MKLNVYVLLALVMSIGACSKLDKKVKDIQSNYMGGLDRTIRVYSLNGTLIKEWESQADISISQGKTLFEIDDKRVIIQGGIVISEEL